MDDTGSHRLSVAPMMAVTDRHFRYFMRQLTRRTKLYTEMYVDNTLIHNTAKLYHFLGHDNLEHPLAVQLGGCDPETVSQAAKICEEWGGFSEVNLNVGCPSKKVQNRCFGAVLMLEPERVRKITYGMIRTLCRTPVTVKCRIGVDATDSYDDLAGFVQAVRSAGVDHIAVHARKALLGGIVTPKGNRSVPPLRHGVVHRLAKDFPELTVVLNGGIQDLEAALEHVEGRGEWGGHCGPVAGVMVGRAAYNNPWMLRHADSAMFGAPSDPGLTRREVVENYLDYCTRVVEETRQVYELSTDIDQTRPGGELPYWTGVYSDTLSKPLHALFKGQRGSNAFRRAIGTALAGPNKRDPLPEMLQDALASLPNEVMDEPVGELQLSRGPE